MNEFKSEMISVLIVDDVQETRDYLTALLRLEPDFEVIGTIDNGRDALRLIPRLQPNVILLDAEMPDLDGYAVAEQLLAEMPHAQIMLMLTDDEPEGIRHAMRIGVRDYLVKPCSIDELAFSIRRVQGSSQVTPLFTPPPPPALLKPKASRLIAFYSPSGGVGVSTLAVNSAIAIKKATGARVVLLDSNEQFGDVSLLINLPTLHSIADLAHQSNELDPELIHQVLQLHTSGVQVLLAPANPKWRPDLTAEKMHQIFAALDSTSDYIICDTGHGLNDVTGTILDAADQIVVVTTDDIAAQKNAKIFFALTQTLGYEDKAILVLNKQANKNLFSPQEIEQNVGHTLAFSFPYDSGVNGAARVNGEPLVLAQPKSPLSRAVNAFAKQFAKADDAARATAPKREKIARPRSVTPALNIWKRSWVRGTVIAVASLLIVLIFFGRVLQLPLADPVPANASAPGLKAALIPLGYGVRDTAGLEMSVLSIQQRQGSAALQVPAGQDAVLVSIRFTNVRDGGLPLSLQSNDFQLMLAENEGHSPALGFVTKTGQSLSTVDVAAGKTYEYDLIWYVPGKTNDFWLAWKADDGQTRLFSLTAAR